MRKRKCTCGSVLRKVSGMRERTPYSAYECVKCGEELMDLAQAKEYMVKVKGQENWETHSKKTGSG